MLRRPGVSLVHSLPLTPSKSILPLICTRNISTQRRPNSTLSTADSFTNSSESSSFSHSNPTPQTPVPPLSTLPTPYLLRTILICTVSTSPFLSNLLTKLLLTYTTFLTSNPIPRFFLKHTFYNHFCAGNTPNEIQSTLTRLKSWGFRGIILAYAKEVEVPAKLSRENISQEHLEFDIKTWKDATVKTIEYAEPNSFVAVKYSGAGPASVLNMETNEPQSPLFMTALDDICKAAQANGKNIKLLFDAEQTRYQDAMDGYTLHLMKRYNTPERMPTVYNTYQMYRKISPSNLKSHLEAAKSQGFGFGAKVVRGAYLHSDPRSTFWEGKEGTDDSYNGGINRLLTFDNSRGAKNGGINVGIVVASHNQTSVTKAMDTLSRLKNEEAGRLLEGKEITFAQLAGMADEVSMSVINSQENGGVNVVKYIPWGTMEQCVKYLLRRADENKDALGRTGETKRAAGREVLRRVKGFFGLST
ncbi:proline dehydrogenase [Orbilia oligospora]|uniref:Proline dehydrogenase n=1 Tax=Orbilia oligospora TaxID=2813651 RepID=A0A6G1M8J7_ORBOL|nr:proline dehydrogenase [Orbilia oligospora]KAF3205832.1 proline dehydrogenase [Orbilia oligospora]KAF3213780.1 proline dehydrogenase [Orbilia oligospora]KAF3214704.1 proline dehydrogenase [Orbilia oligospora]KAF3246947.1 proline dehydrogenase [Orbilia oligospora]